MIRGEFALLILGMVAVTYLPRLLPFVLLRADKLSSRWRELLGYIPHAALGALLIPGCLGGVAGNPLASVAGMLAAALVLWFRPSILLAMMAAVVAAIPFTLR